jgi:hypothetical protein
MLKVLYKQRNIFLLYYSFLLLKLWIILASIWTQNQILMTRFHLNRFQDFLLSLPSFIPNLKLPDDVCNSKYYFILNFILRFDFLHRCVSETWCVCHQYDENFLRSCACKEQLVSIVDYQAGNHSA